MEILRKNVDLNIILNQETDFQTNAGWQENLVAFEDEVLSSILNPIDNYETMRYIHKPYILNNINQTDIWFYFYFNTSGNTPNYVQDYSVQGITLLENEKMMKQSSESFFRLEFFKTPGVVTNDVLVCEPPTRQNRKLVFAKNLSLPLGEKYYYTPLGGYVHLPVFKGSNYENKENMYFFWFQDESVLKETNLSGSTTGNTFFMTAKFFNAKDGSIQDFTNDCFSTSHVIKEENDMYYQVDIDKTDYSYKVYYFNGVVKCDQVGFTNKPINFFEKGGGSCPNGLTYYTCSNVTPTPTPTLTPVSPTPTPTLTLTPTATPVFSKCSDCGLSLNGIPEGLLSVMTAGVITSSIGCTVGEYVIDWYLNDKIGAPEFTSASTIGADPNATVTHPFANEPVQGGTWYPVIKSIYLNGTKYSAYNVNGASYSPDLLNCLSTVTVSNYNCTTGYQNAPYPIYINYTNTTTNSALANRSIRFDLSSDTNYFAWNFIGYLVSDFIKISYFNVSTQTKTQLEYWKIGQDAGSTNLTSNPKIYNGYNLQRVSDLTSFTFSEGNYLIIELTPNSGNSNTNWNFQCKCLTDSGCADIIDPTADFGYTTAGITMYYDNVNCGYAINGLVKTNVLSGTSYYDNNFTRYNSLNISPYIHSNSTPPTPMIFSGRTLANDVGDGYVYYYCQDQNSYTTVTKVGNVITFDFDDITDYNAYKTQYTDLMSRSYMLNYTSDVADINHYKFFQIGVIEGLTCGDNAQGQSYYTSHVSSPIDFNDSIKRITYTIVNVANGLPSGNVCDTRYSTVQYYIDMVNNAISYSNFSYRTYIRKGNGSYYYKAIAVRSFNNYVYNQTANNTGIYTDYIYVKPSVCESTLISKNWVDRGVSYYNYIHGISVTITNESDPLNNFKVESLVNYTAKTYNGVYTKIFEKINGVVKTSSVGTTITTIP